MADFGELRTLTDRAAAARQAADDAAHRREVERYVARMRVGQRLVREVLGVESSEWQPFSTEAATEVDGVFLTTGRSYGGFSTTDVLHFWRPKGEQGNERMEVRNLATLGRFVERYGTDYRPARAPVFGRSADHNQEGES